MFNSVCKRLSEIFDETKNNLCFYRDKILKTIGVTFGFFVAILFMKKYYKHFIPKN
jgi:hypothetical protein